MKRTRLIIVTPRNFMFFINEIRKVVKAQICQVTTPHFEFSQMFLTPESLAESKLASCKVILTSKSVNEIIKCCHSTKNF